MTKKEFAKVMAMIAAAIGKPIAVETVTVYYGLLGQLPLAVFEVAAKRVVLEHKWASFPTVAELQEAAMTTQRGQMVDLSAAEIWQLAWKAVARIDLDLPYTIKKAMTGLPPIVAEAMRAFGLTALVAGKDPVGVVRGQFLKIAEQLVARDKRRLALSGLKEDIAAIAAPPPAPADVRKIAEKMIGRNE